MELLLFKFAFFVLVGLAILGLLAIATMVGTVVLKALWFGLRAHGTIAKRGHA
jgi:hypothetical protein